MKEKTKKKPIALYRQPSLRQKAEWAERESAEGKQGIRGSVVLREAVTLPGIGLSIPVRAAKAKLSALLDMVAAGQDVTITSDGKPKAKLVAAERRRKVFTGTWEQLKKLPLQSEGPFAVEIVRADRDGRGW